MKKDSSVSRALKEVPLFAARYENFIKRLENQSASLSTIKNYGYNLALICLEYGRLPEAITDDEYVEYYNKLLKRKSSGSHMLHAVYCVRKYFKIFGLVCPLSANPSIPSKKTLPVVLSVPEVTSLLKSCVDLREKALLGLLYDTGMRKSELLHLRTYDLDFSRAMIHIREGKRRKDRYVPFSKNMQKIVAAYMHVYHPHEYLFEQERSKPKGTNWPSKVLAAVLKRTDIAKHVSCHVLRHSYATTLLEHGIDLKHIQQWLGHKRLETTAIYLNIAKTSSDQRWIGPTDLIFPVKQ